MIRVGIADDHAIVRSGLRDLIEHEPDMVVVGEAGDGRATMEMVRHTEVDVLLLDLAMPGLDGFDALPRIRARGIATRVLVLTGQDLAQFAVKVLRNGAAGVMSKADEPRTVIDAIRTVAKTGRYLTPEVSAIMADSFAPTAPGSAPHEGLSERELQLLIHFGRRQNSAQVADDLNLSVRTISTYRTLLLRKLGLQTNSDMVHYAMSHKLID